MDGFASAGRRYTAANLLPGYCGLPNAARSGRIILVLTANLHWFFDDSGSEPTGDQFVLGGFLSTADGWAAFANGWQEVLALSPSLEYFKASEAFSLRGQFSRGRGWNDDLRDERVRKLAHVIRQHAKLGVSASIQHAHFEKYMRVIPAVGRRLATDQAYPYLFFRLMTGQLILSEKAGLLDRHDVVMDEQTGMEDEIREIWPGYREMLAKHGRAHYAPMLGSQPYFLNDKEFLPLQAADLYAWHVRDHIVRKRPELGRILRMFRGISSYHFRIRETELKERHLKLMATGIAASRANPLLSLMAFPETKREQKKVRRASARARGAKPSRRRPRA